MLVRHFGHSVGHLKYERQQEINHKTVPRGDGKHGDDETSESKDMEEEIYNESDDTEEPEYEGCSVINNDDSSDGNSESGSSGDSEDDDGGYADL